MKKLSCILLLALFGIIPVTAQKSKSKTEPQTTSALDAANFKGLKWRNIGPFRGGRANAISGVIGNDNVYYVGYTGGGIAKTDDAGITWKNISDGFFKVGSIGEIAICESDPNVIYVGTGEHAVRGVMTSYGDGVYKSTDGGKTWKNIGLEKTRHISEIAIHPNNPDIVLVGAQGAVHGPSSDRGVYKSVDGGATWKKTLYVDENTGVSSLNMDMTNPRIIYAATWQHRRYPWKVESGGPGSAIWKSTDGGDTWTKIIEGLPKEMGKIGVAVSRANPNRVYSIIEAEKSKAGLYRSDDGGKKWNHMTSDHTITARSWYYMEVFPDPINEDVVYVLNAPMTRSIDGGKTFSTLRVGHGDTHDLWINPKTNSTMALADDGGGEISFNTGRSWSPLNNQATAQFYRVNVDNRFPYWVYGGQQDNSSVAIPSRNGSYGITEKDWFNGPGCESAWIAFNDPSNPELLYGGCYQGIIDVLDTRTGEVKDIQEYPATNLGFKPREMKYRFNWNAPLINSPHDSKVLYHAGNVLFKSTNGGFSWEVISPDLTRNDTTKQNTSGGPITNEGAGGENYNTIYYVIESPHERGVIYTGSDCGYVQLTKDGGKTWANITPAGMPEAMIHSIEVSPHDKGTVYITASRYKFNDYSNMTYKSTDYGKTWTKIGGGVEVDDFIKVIREDKKVKDLLYAGSERGFYLSTNGGSSFSKFQLNLPIVPVTDLIIKDNDLIAATAGRAFWILDDLAAIQQSKGSFPSTVKLFTPKPTYRLSSVTIPEYFGDIPGLGRNPANGVALDYYLKEKADTNKVTLEILGADGKLIRKYTNKKDENFKPWPGGPSAPQTIPAEAGVNRFAWDFRTESLTGVQGVYVYGDYSGYRVAPGKYKARVTFKGQSSETELEIISDPKVTATAAEWTAQQEFLKQSGEKFNELHNSVNNMRQVKKQIETLNESLMSNPDAKDLIENGKDILKKIEEWEKNLIEPRSKNFQDVINFPNKLNSEFLQLRGVADTHDPRLTKGVQDRAMDVNATWTKYKQQMNILIEKDIRDYNQKFKEKNLPAVNTEKKETIINN
ncbi:MAG: glycosyl hydrolase [Cyclobacteriaceae bacterium]|nr:glycosyl hydrolase [Cyclobacteriaceae bacterium]